MLVLKLLIYKGFYREFLLSLDKKFMETFYNLDVYSELLKRSLCAGEIVYIYNLSTEETEESMHKAMLDYRVSPCWKHNRRGVSYSFWSAPEVVLFQVFIAGVMTPRGE